MEDAKEALEMISLVPDLREVSLLSLVEESAARTDGAVERVLDLEENGLLTVASFNASI